MPARRAGAGLGQAREPRPARAVSAGVSRRPGGGSSAQPPRRGRRALKTPVYWALVLIALALALAAAVALGPVQLGPAELWAAFLGTGGEAPDGSTAHTIVWQIRLPRALTAAAVGAGLALAGAVTQGLTRNPLADPYLLGLSSGASLGAVLVLLSGLTLLLPLAAFAGAAAALAAALGLAAAMGRLTPTRAILAGLAVGQGASALVSLVVFTSSRGDAFREVMGWLMGSLAGSTWYSVAITGGALALAAPVLVRLGPTLAAFGFGDQAAAALGVRVGATRRLILVAVALLTGAMVCQSGAVGFVGLVVPHIVRLTIGPSARSALALATATGAVFLLAADTLARLAIAPAELPVGIVTAGIGAPVFAWILARSRGVVR
jgi:iron complex transport system permease protein